MPPDTLSNQIDTQIKTKRYTRLLITLGIWIVYNLNVFQFYLQFPSTNFLILYTFGFAIIGMATTWIMYTMIKNFSSNKIYIRLVFFIFLVSFLSGMMASNPLAPLPYDSTLYLTLGTINQVGSFFSFAIILVLMIRDVFLESHTTGYRLLGASCIFLNIGIVFSFVYGVINLLIPNSMGLNAPAELVAYLHCVNYSYFLLASLDPPYESVNGIIRSVGIIQSIFSNLYVVLLIGRLLSK